MYNITLYTIIHKHKYTRLDVSAILGEFHRTVCFTKTKNFSPKVGGGGYKGNTTFFNMMARWVNSKLSFRNNMAVVKVWSL